MRRGRGRGQYALIKRAGEGASPAQGRRALSLLSRNGEKAAGAFVPACPRGDILMRTAAKALAAPDSCFRACLRYKGRRVLAGQKSRPAQSGLL